MSKQIKPLWFWLLCGLAQLAFAIMLGLTVIGVMHLIKCTGGLT